MFIKYYLAYGSNLNIDQMSLRCPYSIPLGKSYLKDYRLVFKGLERSRSYLTIEESEGSIVPIGIYLITEEDEKQLDLYEGYPSSYEKTHLPIEFNNETITGLIYIMQPYFSYNIPSNGYLNTCLKGYQDFSFKEDYLLEALNISNSKKKELKHLKVDNQ